MRSSIRVGCGARAVGVDEPEQPGDREAVHVGVDEADRAARARRARRRGSRSRVDLPTPPLPLVTAMTRVSESGAERHLAGRAAAAQPLGQRAPLVGRHDADLERRHPSMPATDAAAAAPRARCGRRRGSPTIVSTIPTEATPSVDRDVAHHAEVGDRAAQLRVDDRADRAPDGVGGGIGHRDVGVLGLVGRVARRAARAATSARRAARRA